MSTIEPDHPVRQRADETECPINLVELAMFIDGGLAVEMRRRTEAHLTTCEACRWVVASTVRLQRPRRAGGR